jgi:hypothetical protein
MNGGEFLTRASVWLAIAAYAIGAAMLIVAKERPRVLRRARWAWTIGCGCFVAHVAGAFAYFHHWSHVAAYDETARQTADLTGWRWGGGLYLNYLFTLGWLIDVLWWWRAPEQFAQRSRTLIALWQGFMFFMVLNGTVVFGRGPVRWLGAIVCGGLAGMYLWQQRETIATRRRQT